jgi:hypothetical protein
MPAGVQGAVSLGLPAPAPHTVPRAASLPSILTPTLIHCSRIAVTNPRLPLFYLRLLRLDFSPKYLLIKEIGILRGLHGKAYSSFVNKLRKCLRLLSFSLLNIQFKAVAV